AFDGPDNYLLRARSLASESGLALTGRRTAYRPPLYPMVLAPLVGGPSDRVFWRIALLHLGLGAGTVWLTAAAAERFGLSRGRVMVAALITACDPVLIWQSRSVMTETPTAFLVAGTLAALAVGGGLGAVLGGVGFGLSSLCRPSMLVGAVLTMLAGLVMRPGALRERLVRGCVLALTLGLVLLPWMIRNLLLLGEP